MNLVGELKFFLDERVYAQLKFSESKTALSIDIVFVPASHRKQGIGSTLIEHILLMADGMDKDVYVSARPIGSADEETLNRLIEYYRRFGFEVYDTGETVAYMRKKAPDKPGQATRPPNLISSE